MQCHASGHQIFPNSLPRVTEDIYRGGKYCKHVSDHIVSLLATNLINISGFAFKKIKTINGFTFDEHLVSLENKRKQFKAVKSNKLLWLFKKIAASQSENV